jgi:primase-polymerase (primpol)-like protein
MNLPLEIRQLNSFLTWKLTYKQGQAKPAKIPFYANGRARGAPGPDDIAQLVSYDEA